MSHYNAGNMGSVCRVYEYFTFWKSKFPPELTHSLPHDMISKFPGDFLFFFFFSFLDFLNLHLSMCLLILERGRPPADSSPPASEKVPGLCGAHVPHVHGFRVSLLQWHK